MTVQPLSTVDEVIEALGGHNAAAELTGRSPQAVWNWAARKNFPPDLYVLMNDALSRRGKAAMPALWKQHAPEPAQ